MSDELSASGSPLPAAGSRLPASGFPLPAAGSQLPAFVSVKFSPAGRTVSFLLPHLMTGVVPGEQMVVETTDGQAMGTVTRVAPQVAERRQPPADSPQVVVRRASHDDVVQRLKHAQREQEAQRVAQLKIRERGLPMKLTKVEHVFDGSRLIFYYTSESRVDFRELVRDLAAHFRMRIEMRQIGVRDEAKMLGGYGSCGRPLCCTTWLRSFEPVSIKMAKQQQLSLNPSKLSGQCGRLKCCLRYELPNGEGVKHAGCGDHGGCSNPTGCGNCGTEGGCGSCGHHA